MSKVNLNILIDEDIRQDFKTACAKNGVSMTDVLTDYILEYLNEKIQSS